MLHIFNFLFNNLNIFRFAAVVTIDDKLPASRYQFLALVLVSSPLSIKFAS